MSETKICQNCEQKFEVTVGDKAFYAKIEVPEPTFCPDCRAQRRFVWRNERTFHKNTCAKSGKKLISTFPKASGLTIYERELWWSNDWNPTDYGKEYDFSKSFFEQFKKLMRTVPWPSVFNAQTENSAYVAYTSEVKNAYLISASWKGENLAYGARIIDGKDSMDVFTLTKCELCYEITSCGNLNSCFFCQDCEACADSWFLFDCKGCTNCFGCTNLRNKSYYIWNQPHSKKEYQEKIKELKTGSYTELQKLKEKFEKLKKESIHRYAHIINSQNVTGDHIRNAVNCHSCFDLHKDGKDCKFLTNSLELEESYDGYGVGATAELLYEVFDAGDQASRLLFCGTVYGDTNVAYTLNSYNCNNIFGCIGLRKKEYCILNKEYSKEESEKLIPKIKEHMISMPYMDKGGREYRYGEFFPIELSPFAYNETVAQDYYPLTKEKTEKKGYLWREPTPPSHKPTVKAEELPDDIQTAQNDIIKELINCLSCEKVFKIIPRELTFLKKFDIPLPRLCPECRHMTRFKKVAPPKLWQRECMCDYKIFKNTTKHSHHPEEKCSNKFETTYNPEREEIIYCEPCYQAEVA